LDKGAEIANPTEIAVEGVRRIRETNLDLVSPQILIETPASYQAIKVHDLKLAISWRMQTRALFEAYFGKDYVAKEFVSELWDGERRNFFLLERA
jgi:predicted GNAT superfamily acetyltransferase